MNDAEPQRMSTFVQQLRARADWYEAHPDVPEPYIPTWNVFLTTRAELAAVARQVGDATKGDTDTGFFFLRVERPDFAIDFNVPREQVCTSRVVGERVIPAQPERTEPIIEWDCGTLCETPTPTGEGAA